MKAKVLYGFKDKYSGESHEPGKILTISKERFAEIVTVAPYLVEKIAEPKRQSKATK